MHLEWKCGIATIENSVENKAIPSEYITQVIEIKVSEIYLYTTAHSIIIHNSQEVDVLQVFVDR